MKLALYIGKHTKDKLSARIGWWLTRLVQKGRFANVTHVEAILKEHEDGSVTIGSASLRDGGVRMKRVYLNPDHWIIVDVPKWSADDALLWFIEHDGEPYDWRGAFASCMPFQWREEGEWFCNEAVAASIGFDSPEVFGPSQFSAICYTLSNQ